MINVILLEVVLKHTLGYLLALPRISPRLLNGGDPYFFTASVVV